MSATLIDALLALVILLSAWAGVRRGFVFAAVALATLLASLALALTCYEQLSGWLVQFIPALGVWSSPASFLIIFIAAHILLGAIGRRLALLAPPRFHLHVANRTLGVVPGALNGVINALLLAMLLQASPFTEAISAAARESEWLRSLDEPAGWVEAQFTPIFEPAIRSALPDLTAAADPHEPVALHFKVSDPHSRPDLEAQMLALVNAERAKLGLKTMRADPEIADVARAHSRDMFARGYFSHATPEGVDMAQRLKAANLRYLIAGENLAFSQSLQAAHAGLMKSPGHRANILRPQYTRVGIAVLDGGKFGLMITQNFRN